MTDQQVGPGEDFPAVADDTIEVDFDEIDPGKPEDDTVFIAELSANERSLLVATAPGRPFTDQCRPDSAEGDQAQQGDSDA